MTTREEIDQKYIDKAIALEAEFFDIADAGLPNQHRVLKVGSTINGFNLRHSNIWKAHEAELIAVGFMEAPTPSEPGRDLAAEVTALAQRVKLLEDKVK